MKAGQPDFFGVMNNPVATETSEGILPELYEFFKMKNSDIPKDAEYGVLQVDLIKEDVVHLSLSINRNCNEIGCRFGLKHHLPDEKKKEGPYSAYAANVLERLFNRHKERLEKSKEELEQLRSWMWRVWEEREEEMFARFNTETTQNPDEKYHCGTCDGISKYHGGTSEGFDLDNCPEIWEEQRKFIELRNEKYGVTAPRIHDKNIVHVIKMNEEASGNVSVIRLEDTYQIRLNDYATKEGVELDQEPDELTALKQNCTDYI